MTTKKNLQLNFFFFYKDITEIKAVNIECITADTINTLRAN